MPTLALSTSEDLDGDGTPETIRQDSATLAWHIGSHVYTECMSCSSAIIVDFDKDDRRREVILFGYPEDETIDVVVLQVTPTGITTTKWTTSDGEVLWDASGSLWVDKCGDTRTLYDLRQGRLVPVQQEPSPTLPLNCPG